MNRNRNEEKKGKGIREKGGNLDWKEGQEKVLKRRKWKEFERKTGMERDREGERE